MRWTSPDSAAGKTSRMPYENSKSTAEYLNIVLKHERAASEEMFDVDEDQQINQPQNRELTSEAVTVTALAQQTAQTQKLLELLMKQLPKSRHSSPKHDSSSDDEEDAATDSDADPGPAVERWKKRTSACDKRHIPWCAWRCDGVPRRDAVEVLHRQCTDFATAQRSSPPDWPKRGETRTSSTSYSVFLKR